MDKHATAAHYREVARCAKLLAAARAVVDLSVHVDSISSAFDEQIDALRAAIAEFGE